MTAASLEVPAAPLASATRQLQDALTALFRADARAVGPAPVVVPLGAADTTGNDADPYAAARPTASVHLAPDAVIVGPWGAAPGTRGACGRCLAVRWQRLRARSVRDALEIGSSTEAADGWPSVPGFLADATWALYRAVRSQEVPKSRLAPAAKVSRLDFASLGVQTVELLADPLCPACAQAQPPAPPMRLVARAKPSERSYRLRPADSYRLPGSALANPVCGALGVGTALDLASPTTAAVSGNFVERGRGGLNDVGFSGKADSFKLSRDLGFLEGFERYAGTRPRGAGEVVVDSLENLGEAALDPRDCGVYADETYRRDPILRPFSPKATIPWVWGHSLRDDRPILVPARSAYYAVGAASDDFVFECSNGCAIGSCLEEATLFGLLELIERDAFLLGWYGGASLTEIELASVRSRTVQALVDRAVLHGYDVHLLDNRVDLSIPVVTCVAVRKDGGPGMLSFAAGASLDPEAAAEAAVGEALTYLPHMAHEVRKRQAEVEAMAHDFDKVVELRDHALLFGLPSSAAYARRYLEPARVLPFREVYPDHDAARGSHDLLDDLVRCQREIVGAGCDVIVVDQTPPEQARLGLRTVRTLAPGLLPIDFGWARQRALGMTRLRSAFVRAGWRSTPLADADLHRVPHPFP